MNKVFLTAVMIIAALTGMQTAKAQGGGNTVTGRVYKVGIFAPLYLDSVFSKGNFRYAQGIPRFIAPALEFVQGAQIALDSLQTGGQQVEAYIYDSKAYTKTIPYLVQNKKLDSLDLIIGSVKDIEFRQLADFSLQKNIPFISATYPNDAGVSNNPFLVIMNSTLKAHCEAIYSFILQNYGTDKIYLCRQNGTQEDKVAGYFKTLNEPDGKPLLNIQTLNFDDNLSAEVLKKKLDSNRNSVIIGASLDEAFATSLATACHTLQASYPLTLIGMPTWDGFAGLRKKGTLEDFPIYYTAPYFNNKWDNYSKIVINGYNKKFKTRPSDMAFKGFETTYMFTKLLLKYPDDIISQLNDKSVKVFTDYNFRPVMLEKGSVVPDYFENKHLYFVKILNGALTKAW